MKEVIAILVSGLFASVAFAAPVTEKALTIPEKVETAAPAEAGKIKSADALKAARVEADKAAPVKCGKKAAPVKKVKKATTTKKQVKKGVKIEDKADAPETTAQ